jgi:hypothetical protein
VTFPEIIASLAVPAAAVASAAALVWRTQRADVVALNARLDAADAKRDAYHSTALAQVQAQLDAARGDAARLTAALSESTAATRASNELMERVVDALESHEPRESVAPIRRAVRP